MTGPCVRFELDLGDYRPPVIEEEDDWRPITYTVKATHVSQLTSDGNNVTRRQLERLTLVLTNDEPDAWEETQPAELALPATVEGLEALIAILDNARDYVAQEARS